MANQDSPHGFPSVASLNGRPGYFRNYAKAVGYGTAVGYNDLVDSAASGIDIERGAAGGPFLGISYAYSAASTAATHPVEILHFDNIVEGQTDGSLVAADTGLKADIVVAAANATTGISAMEIDASTEAATATLDLYLLRLAPYADNAAGTNSRWFCNVHDLRLSTVVAGE